MARSERNNVDYFPHPVTHKKKMYFIEKKYGNDGYATWFKILEILGLNNYHFIDLKEETDKMFLASYCGVPEKTLLFIIQDLVKFGEFHKQLWDDESILFNENFIASVKDAYRRRSNNAVTLTTLYALLTSIGRLNGMKCSHIDNIEDLNSGKNPQRIGKDRIGNSSETEINDDIKKNEATTLSLAIKIIIKDLNKRTGADYKFNNNHTEYLIFDLWELGYRVKDFIEVNRHKVNEWKDDAEMAKNLRPKTLYASDKFEGYLTDARRSGKISSPTHTKVIDSPAEIYAETKKYVQEFKKRWEVLGHKPEEMRALTIGHIMKKYTILEPEAISYFDQVIEREG